MKIIVPKSANLSKESCKTLEDNNIFSDHSPFIPDVPRSNLQIIMDAKSIPSPIASQFDKLPEFKNTLNSFPPKAQQFYSKVLEGYDPKLPANNQANQNLRQKIGLTIIKHQQMLTHSGFGLVEKQQHNARGSNTDNIKESDRYEEFFDILLKQNQQDPSRNNSFKILNEVKDFFNIRKERYNDSVARNFLENQRFRGTLSRKSSISWDKGKGNGGRG